MIPAQTTVWRRAFWCAKSGWAVLFGPVVLVGLVQAGAAQQTLPPLPFAGSQPVPQLPLPSLLNPPPSMPATSALAQQSPPASADQPSRPPPPPTEPSPKAKQETPEELPTPRRGTGKDNDQPGKDSTVPVDPNVLPIDLLSALKLTDAQNPTIGVARARLEVAYARLEEAHVGWLPNLFAGGNPYSPSFAPTFFGHYGAIQNASGVILKTVQKNAVFLPVGVTMDFGLSDAIFLPLVARRLVGAQAANVQVVNNNIELDVALTYLDLLRTYNQLAINAETLANAEVMLRNAEAADKAGTGKTPADATQARAEVSYRRQVQLDLRRRALVFSARLAQLLLLDPAVDLRPADSIVVPVCLVDVGVDLHKLIEIGYENRPEMKREGELLAASQIRSKQAKCEPFLPIVQVFYDEGWYGGGNPDFRDSNNRQDVIAQACWQFRNMGFGNLATIHERNAQVGEAMYTLTETQAQVGAEVTAATQEVRLREQALRVAAQTVQNAAETFRRLEKASFGLALGVADRKRQYEPLDALIAVRTLDEARFQYLNEVIEYNRAQFRLYTVLGQPPLCALPGVAKPLEVPTAPTERTRDKEEDKTKDEPKDKTKDKPAK